MVAPSDGTEVLALRGVAHPGSSRGADITPAGNTFDGATIGAPVTFYAARFVTLPYASKYATMVTLMARYSAATMVKVGPQGRLVIPAALRKALKVEPGAELVARIEGEQLIMELREAVERRLKSRFAHIPRSVSLVDELFAQRREEARNELTGS